MRKGELMMIVLVGVAPPLDAEQHLLGVRGMEVGRTTCRGRVWAME